MENLTSVVDVLGLANTFTGGIFGFLILIAIGFGSFLISSQYEAKVSLVSSAFITFATAFFLRYLGMIPISDKIIAITVAAYVAVLLAFAATKNPNT